MKKTAHWQMGGFVFVGVAGTLLHFLFDWTGGNVAAALFSAVNESIWEHLKLLFYPWLVFAVAEYVAWGRGMPHFWRSKVLGLLAGLTLIPVLYYTYTGALGVKADWFNIAIFFLAAGLSFWLETRLLGKSRPGGRWAIPVILLLAVAFSVFTFRTPHIPLFQDPVNGSYGYFQTE